VRKHRIIERLPDRLHGLHRAESHVHADELGDTFSDEMIERIDERLGHPTAARTAGRSTPTFEQAENASSSPLAELEPARGDDRPLAEHDGDLLHWFYDEGLVPGSQVAVVSAQPAAGQLTIAIDGASARSASAPRTASTSARPSALRIARLRHPVRSQAVPASPLSGDGERDRQR
jgi:DtxR family Mn-dependent transcriptional regulator